MKYKFQSRTVDSHDNHEDNDNGLFPPSFNYQQYMMILV